MLKAYFPVLLFLIIGIGFSVVPLLIGRFIAPHHPDVAKNAAFECGFPAFETARIPFDVRYYLIAILFIVFDLEAAFLLPWATIMRDLSSVALIAMLIFIIELVLGLVYVWKIGALDWE